MKYFVVLAVFGGLASLGYGLQSTWGWEAVALVHGAMLLIAGLCVAGELHNDAS